MKLRNAKRTDDQRPRRPAPGQPDLLAALASPDTYPRRPPVVVHETHASWVFVAGDRAYKVKKPVDLGFLDYRTLARRHACCREEVRVNQRLAAGIYLGVRAIVPRESGYRLARDGAPGAVEYAVEMRSFREADTLAGLIATGALAPGHVIEVARLLAEFHRTAPVVREWGPDRALAIWQRNVLELQQAPHPAHWSVEDSAAFGSAFVHAHAEEIAGRAQLGLARDGHGDLRCEHVLVAPAIRVVDRIEFDSALRRTDVASDLAFLTMDLEAHDQRWAARTLVSAYREAGMDPGSEALGAFYAAHRALVRAKVALLSQSGPTPRAASQACLLWSLAERLCWRARAPLAVVICGPAASGKSVLAGELSHGSEIPVVSSDAVRKRLAGIPPSERARPEHYEPEFTRRTYEALGRDALAALQRGGSVIVDATCRSHAERALLLGRLREFGLTPLVVRCELPLELALSRARRRLRDPDRKSDATPEIVAMQFTAFEELDERSEGRVLRLRTDQPLPDQLSALRRAADRLLREAKHDRSTRRSRHHAAPGAP